MHATFKPLPAAVTLLLVASVLLAGCDSTPRSDSAEAVGQAQSMKVAEVKQSYYDWRSALNSSSQDDAAVAANAAGVFLQHAIGYVTGHKKRTADAINETHEGAKELLMQISGQPAEQLAKRVISQKMLSWVLLPAGNEVDDELLLFYAKMAIQNLNPNFPTIIEALDSVEGHDARVEQLASSAQASLQALQEISQDDASQATQSSNSQDATVAAGQTWSPEVEGKDGSWVRLDIERTKANLAAFTR